MVQSGTGHKRKLRQAGSRPRTRGGTVTLFSALPGGRGGQTYTHTDDLPECRVQAVTVTQTHPQTDGNQ